jgi:hypothetical protein
MVNYGQGKIYKIHPRDNTDVCYIGATTKKYLCQRMGMHRVHQRSGHNHCRTKQLFEQYGMDNCVITLLEDFPCETKDQLTARERFYIEDLRRQGVQVVNAFIPSRTHKEWYQDNRDAILTKKKCYYRNHRDAILEKMRIRREALSSH